MENLLGLMNDLNIISDDKGGSMDHPLDQYKLIRRYNEDWPEIIDKVKAYDIEIPNMGETPNSEDLEGTIDGILRLQVDQGPHFLTLTFLTLKFFNTQKSKKFSIKNCVKKYKTYCVKNCLKILV